MMVPNVVVVLIDHRCDVIRSRTRGKKAECAPWTHPHPSVVLVLLETRTLKKIHRLQKF